jgi:hypothetical protein
MIKQQITAPLPKRPAAKKPTTTPTTALEQLKAIINKEGSETRNSINNRLDDLAFFRNLAWLAMAVFFVLAGVRLVLM